LVTVILPTSKNANVKRTSIMKTRSSRIQGGDLQKGGGDLNFYFEKDSKSLNKNNVAYYECLVLFSVYFTFFTDDNILNNIHNIFSVIMDINRVLKNEDNLHLISIIYDTVISNANENISINESFFTIFDPSNEYVFDISMIADIFEEEYIVQAGLTISNMIYIEGGNDVPSLVVSPPNVIGMKPTTIRMKTVKIKSRSRSRSRTMKSRPKSFSKSMSKARTFAFNTRTKRRSSALEKSRRKRSTAVSSRRLIETGSI